MYTCSSNLAQTRPWLVDHQTWSCSLPWLIDELGIWGSGYYAHWTLWHNWSQTGILRLVDWLPIQSSLLGRTKANHTSAHHVELLASYLSIVSAKDIIIITQIWFPFLRSPCLGVQMWAKTEFDHLCIISKIFQDFTTIISVMHTSTASYISCGQIHKSREMKASTVIFGSYTYTSHSNRFSSPHSLFFKIQNLEIGVDNAQDVSSTSNWSALDINIFFAPQDECSFSVKNGALLDLCCECWETSLHEHIGSHCLWEPLNCTKHPSLANIYFKHCTLLQYGLVQDGGMCHIQKRHSQCI